MKYVLQNQVGLGRYDLHRVLDSQYVNSHESIFQSKSGAQLSKEKSEILRLVVNDSYELSVLMSILRPIIYTEKYLVTFPSLY